VRVGGGLSEQDLAAVAAWDVSRLLAGAPGLRQIVELANRHAPHDDPDFTGGVGDWSGDSSRAEHSVDVGVMPITRHALPA
jgi:hypothetical protein